MTNEEKFQKGIVIYKTEDDVICEALGSHIVEKYTEAKIREWNEYKNSVSSWEISNYLDKY